jgi:hypothetical protein
MKRRCDGARVHGQWSRWAGVQSLRAGDRVVVPFPVPAVTARSASADMLALRETQSNAWMAGAVGLFAVRHLQLLAHARWLRRQPGRNARVPYADVNPLKVRELDDEHCCSSDIFPTGYMAAKRAASNRATPSPSSGAAVGQFAIKAPTCRGGRVIAIDRFPCPAAHGTRSRQATPSTTRGCLRALEEMTGGRGFGPLHRRGGPRGHTVYTAPTGEDRHDAQTDRPVALRQAFSPAAAAARCRWLASTAVSSASSDGRRRQSLAHHQVGPTHVQRYAVRC